MRSPTEWIALPHATAFILAGRSLLILDLPTIKPCNMLNRDPTCDARLLQGCWPDAQAAQSTVDDQASPQAATGSACGFSPISAAISAARSSRCSLETTL